MRVLVLLLLLPLAVWAQPAGSPVRFDVGAGVGVAREDGIGYLGPMATASARSGWATAQIRGQLAVPIWGTASRWEAAGLVGPTWAGRVGRGFVGVGVGVAGGNDGTTGLCIACASRPQRDLDPAVGLALAGEGAIRIFPDVWYTVRADANVNGPRALASGSLGVRLGL